MISKEKGSTTHGQNFKTSGKPQEISRSGKQFLTSAFVAMGVGIITVVTDRDLFPIIYPTSLIPAFLLAIRAHLQEKRTARINDPS